MKTFDVVRMRNLFSVESYTEIPKTVTAVTHADLSDDTEFHCIWTGVAHDVVLGKQSSEGRPYCIKKIFAVPRQALELLWDPTYGRFYAIEVIPKFKVSRLYSGKRFCLVAQANGQSGFLVPLDELALGIQEQEERRPDRTLAA